MNTIESKSDYKSWTCGSGGKGLMLFGIEVVAAQF